MRKASSLFTGLFLACLLFSCDGNSAQSPAPPPTSPVFTPVPTPTQPSTQPSPKTTALEVGDFSTEAALEKIGYGCSLSLKRTKEDANYVFFEGNGKALMSIEGNLVEFPSEFGSADSPTPLRPENPRTLVSNDGQYTLTLDVSYGDRIGEEVIDIPAATLEIQTENGSATAISAVGETGC